MPMMPKRACTKSGCPNYAVINGRCEQHKRQSWEKNNAEKRVIKGRTLQRERDRLFNEFPLCAECERQGRVTVAVIRDHIKPLAEGGEDTEDNTQGLCVACHDKKSAGESKRGRGALHL